jgi:hypothetical protein
VFFCELEESEVDPRYGFMAILIYLSSRDAKEVTKTMRKGRGIDYALMSPPSIEQMKVMMKVQMKISPNSSYNFINKSFEKVNKIIDERIKMIGPIPRYVFGDESGYIDYVESISVDAKNLWKDIDSLEVFKIPQHVKTLAAPFVREGVDIPMTGEFVFCLLLLSLLLFYCC